MSTCITTPTNTDAHLHLLYKRFIIIVSYQYAIFETLYKNTSTFVFRFTIYCKVHITDLMIDQTSNGYYIYHVTAICNLGFFIIHLSVPFCL